MPAMFDPAGRAADPFTVDVDVEGAVTHGHLPENDNHGGGRFSGLSNPIGRLARPIGGGGQGRDPGLRLRPGRPLDAGQGVARRRCAGASA